MEPILLYSGGKESLLCLKYLSDQGEDPTILHFHTQKISDHYEKIIKRNAMRIHKTPYYYTIKTDTMNYNATYSYETGLYSVYTDEDDNHEVYPHEYGDPVHIGYVKRDTPSMKKGINFLELYRPETYKFPHKDKTTKQIIEEWQQLPKDIRRNTVSSTIYYFNEYGGKAVKDPTDT